MKSKLFLVGLLTLPPVMAQPSSSSSEPAPEIRMMPWPLNETFPWITRGKLIAFSSVLPGARTGVLCFYQRPNGRETVLVTGSLPGVNEVLSSEAPEAASARELLSCIPELLVVTTGQSATRILDQRYLSEYRENLKFEGDQRTMDRLETLCKPIQVKITESTWELGFYVINSLGGVERWNASGRLKPLRVDQFTREVIEANGVLKPFTTY